MAEALVYTDEWTSTELTGYDGPRIPDTWNYPVFTVGDGTAAAFMGDPHHRLVEIAAALTDAPIAPVDARDDALRILADLCAAVPDVATLEARLEPFGFLVGEVRSVAQLSETPWTFERGVFTEVEPGARRDRPVPLPPGHDRGTRSCARPASRTVRTGCTRSSSGCASRPTRRRGCSRTTRSTRSATTSGSPVLRRRHRHPAPRRHDRCGARPVRLGLAPREGLAEPVQFAKELQGFEDAEIRMITGTNCLELLG